MSILFSNCVVQVESTAISVTSDASTVSSDDAAPEGAVLVNGYHIAHAIVMVDTWLDSDATVTPTFQKNTATTTRVGAAATDFSDIAAGTALTCSGDSDGSDVYGYYIDLVKAGISTGLLRTSLVASASDSATARVIWLFTRASQRLPDTDQITWEEVAS